MAIIATAGGNGGDDFQPAPAGTYRAVCVDVIDKGIVEVTYQGKTKRQHKVSVAWLIDEKRDDGKPYLVFKRYTLSLNEKATLRKDLESWRGKAFTRDEEMGFDVEAVLGANCLLNVQHQKKGDKTYANVVSVMPLMKGMPPIDGPFEYIRQVNRTPEQVAATPPHDEPPPLTDDDYADSVPF